MLGLSRTNSNATAPLVAMPSSTVLILAGRGDFSEQLKK